MAVEFQRGNSLYRVTGLDERATQIETAASTLSTSLGSALAAARTALNDWSGPLAESFVEQFNTVASRIVTLELSARTAAAACRAFPDAAGSSSVYGDYEYRAARVYGSASPAVSADVATMKAAGTALSGLTRDCNKVGAAVTTEGVTATVATLRDRTAAEQQVLVGQGVAPGVVNSEQVWGEPVWTPINELLKLPDLTAEAATAGSQADELGIWTTATAVAVQLADQGLIDLLLQHPELARYFDGHPDDDGHMGGESALLVMLAYLDKLDTLGGGATDGTIDLADLQTVADDPTASELLKAAAEYLLANRLLLSQASLDDQTAWERNPDAASLSGDTIRRFLAFNDSIRTVSDGFDTFAGAAGPDTDRDPTVSKADLEAVANGGFSAEQRAAAAFLLANPALAERLGVYGAANVARKYGAAIGNPPLSGMGQEDITRGSLWVIGVDQQAYAAHPNAARRFVLSLPMADRNGNGGIPVELMSDEGVKALASSALLDTNGDLSDVHAVIAHLPETVQWDGPHGAVTQRGGVRNELINSFYDLLGVRADAVLAGPDLAGSPTLPGHPGANWLKFAPWASSSVGDVIRGDVRPLGLLPPEVQQAAADGNQWIFNDIGQRFTSFVELYEGSPNPTEAQLESFFADEFADGDGTIRNGFAAFVASMDAGDPARAQQLVYQGNVLVAIHEQAGAQVYLERISWGPDQVAAVFVDANVGGVPLNLDMDLPAHANASNLVAAANITSMDVDGLNAADFSTGGSHFAVGGGATDNAVVDLAPIAGTELYRPDFSQSSTVWYDHGGPPDGINYGEVYVEIPHDPDSLVGTGATSWPDWNERMNSITRMFEQWHTDDALYNTTEIVTPLGQIPWLDPSSIPR